MKLKLENDIAVVTGGASGIGRAVVESFANEGVSVTVWDIDENTADMAANLASQTGQNICGRIVDVTSENAVREAFRETTNRIGPIDHLVHAAAIGSGRFGFPFTNLKPEDWRRVLEVNIMGMVNVAHAMTPSMVERAKGTMAFIASVAGQIGSPTDPPYSASKAANINFAQCIARDLAPYGIRVNVVCPGMVKTPLNQSVWKAWNLQQSEENKTSYDDWADEKIRNVVPLQRWQQPADIADMVVFLASERAAQVTGQTINVDGGFVMHS